MLSRTRCSRDSRRNGDETQLFFVSVTTWAPVHMHVPHNLHWVYLYTLACFPLVSTPTSDSGSRCHTIFVRLLPPLNFRLDSRLHTAP